MLCLDLLKSDFPPQEYVQKKANRPVGFAAPGAINPDVIAGSKQELDNERVISEQKRNFGRMFRYRQNLKVVYHLDTTPDRIPRE